MQHRNTLSPSAAPWGWCWAGLLTGWLLATLWFAPARWLGQLLAHASDGQIVLSDTRGSVWRGSGQLSLHGGAGSQSVAHLPQQVNWAIQPTTSGLALELMAHCCMQKAWRLQLDPHFGGATLNLADSQSQWPADLLIGLGTPWNTLQAQGTIALATRGLSLAWTQGRLQILGSAQLDASQISSRLSTLRPMGSYRIHLTGGTPSTLRLETLDGSLQLSGSGQWVGSRLRFDGVASAAPERLDALSNLLNIIGRRDGARAIIKVG